jgi:hypothetical protein
MAEEQEREPHVGEGGELRTAALDLVHGTIRVSVNGGKPRVLKVNALTVEALSAALNSWPSQMFANIVMVGTTHDGRRGWDSVPWEKLAKDTAHELTSLTEAEALHLQYGAEGEKVGFLILAENRGGYGSARWWVAAENDDLTAVDVMADEVNFGQVYTISGGSITRAAYELVMMVEQFFTHHPDTTRLYIWSQQGMEGPVYAVNGAFWNLLTEEHRKRVTIRPSPFEPLVIASQPLATQEG